ncbi:IucA/IucC family protein [Halocatena salina]|uniref:IucA/IucC family siderophore biosynthesis protein n=1 Tax=Halocatena salina TaxID=2934340 RepID=A0A8U0A1Z4_9EURY|nr:IucA/IucC family protein [Halocatena salina]UPM42007.1 IucA/IucC family siderophore biosynthesis protein [Halocatena salina]
MTARSPDPESIARAATTHGLLNCYFRETGSFDRREPAVIDHPDCAVVFYSELSNMGIELAVPVRHDSPTGRHLFALPVCCRSGSGDWIELDYTTLASVIVRDLALSRSDPDSADELLLGIIRSCQNTARYVAARDDVDRLYGDEPTFRDAEQSLVFGHLLHPTPKHREGIAKRDEPTYAPELRGQFQLHYFRAAPELVNHGSAREASAVELVKTELRDFGVPAGRLDGDDALVPVHPWQAAYLLDQPHVESAIESGTLEHLGALGPTFYPTSSVRTLYSPNASFMVKGSLNVRITNSVRTNKQPELRRGMAVSELLETDLGTQLRERYPAFDIVRDPAYLTLDLGSERESGFEVVLRENPFCEGHETGVTPVVALCQDHVHSTHLTGDGDATRSRLSNIIHTIAEREGRDTAAVSKEWFQQYLSISVRPVLWLYLTYGIGLEAHQQNSVLAMEDGYPDRFYYRDNQGYYFAESTYETVDAFVPGVGERADTICRDEVTDERIRYYVILNNAFGLINAFGSAGLIEEPELLGLLRTTLRELRAVDRDSSTLLEELLTAETLPCKANLLTRLHGMDELEGSIENQSVYTEIDNPLVTELEVSGR